jgi:thymidylate synthase
MAYKFKNAEEAFVYFYNKINTYGENHINNKCLFNIGFYIANPLDNIINNKNRNFNKEYAEYEWQWYLSGNNNAKEISKKAKIWLKCMDKNGNVNSNYGYQWNKGNQIDYIVNELKNNKYSRRASISIYDAKDRYNFKNDTPCTYAINFNIYNNKLNMSVMMRSNDLWYGFCNDQYCFSKLQELIANKLNISIGTYYHFTNNLHIYNNFLNKQI